MDEEKKIKVSTRVDFSSAVFVAFICFWMFGGMYRVDCALGIQKACQRISADKEYAEVKP